MKASEPEFASRGQDRGAGSHDEREAGGVQGGLVREVELELPEGWAGRGHEPCNVARHLCQVEPGHREPDLVALHEVIRENGGAAAGCLCGRTRNVHD